MIAAVLQKSGLVELFVAHALAPFHNLTAVFIALTLLIAVTALLIPSTSGRAALFTTDIPGTGIAIAGSTAGPTHRTTMPDDHSFVGGRIVAWSRGTSDFCRCH